MWGRLILNHRLMKKEEKEILKKINEFPNGLLSQTDLLKISNGNTKVNHSLIVGGFIEETKRKIKGIKLGFQEEATFYRITGKGKLVFEPFAKRTWFSIKGDIRTIIVSFVTTIITLILNHYFSTK